MQHIITNATVFTWKAEGEKKVAISSIMLAVLLIYVFYNRYSVFDLT